MKECVTSLKSIWVEGYIQLVLLQPLFWKEIIGMEQCPYNTGLPKKRLPTSVNIEYSSSFKSAGIVIHLA